MTAPTQNYGNHRKFVFAYHRVATALLLLPWAWMVFKLATDPSWDRLALFLFATGTIVAAFFARVFPTGVQDRVIRLEERLRLQDLLPEDLAARLGEITTPQLVGLRFAADDEVGELVRRVLDGELSGADEIKRAIRNWRPDHQRI